MARIAGVDLPRTKRVEVGLTYIYGIGQNDRLTFWPRRVSAVTFGLRTSPRTTSAKSVASSKRRDASRAICGKKSR